MSLSFDKGKPFLLLVSDENKIKQRIYYNSNKMKAGIIRNSHTMNVINFVDK